MGRGSLVCRAAAPASALASLPVGVRESTMDVESIDPVAVYAALMSTVALGWQIWKEHQARRPRLSQDSLGGDGQSPYQITVRFWYLSISLSWRSL